MGISGGSRKFGGGVGNFGAVKSGPGKNGGLGKFSHIIFFWKRCPTGHQGGTPGEHGGYLFTHVTPELHKPSYETTGGARGIL